MKAMNLVSSLYISIDTDLPFTAELHEGSRSQSVPLLTDCAATASPHTPDGHSPAAVATFLTLVLASFALNSSASHGFTAPTFPLLRR